MSYHDTAIVGIIYYCTRIGVSVLRTGRGRAGGGGGEVEFLTEKKNSAKKCSWGLKTQKKKVPGVLKRIHQSHFFVHTLLRISAQLSNKLLTYMQQIHVYVDINVILTLYII